jgi:asparagine synthase (glutamine-hydrolysing)
MKYYAGFSSLSVSCHNSDELLDYFDSSDSLKESVCFYSNGAFCPINYSLKPSSDIETGSLCYDNNHAVIIGDVVVANRGEIGRLLEVTNDDLEKMNDLLLLLHCYIEWGVDCLQYIVGEFSFALWDKKEQFLFCAIDHLGVKSFFYKTLPNGTVLISNKLRELVVNKKYQVQISKEYLVDYLLGVFPEKGRTVYDDIFRVPPGNYLLCNSQGISCHKYWHPVVNCNSKSKNTKNYPLQLKKLIVEAVQGRIEQRKKYGVLLSGGLDSSAVACIAKKFLQKREKMLSAFSHVLPDDYSGEDRDERSFIHLVKEHTGINVKYSTDTNGMSQDAFDCYFQSKYTLPFHPFLCTSDPLHQAVSVENIDVLLTGYGGDDVASNQGVEYFSLLAKQGRWITLWQLLQKRSHIEGTSIKALLKRTVVLPLTPSMLLKCYRKIKGSSQPHPIEMGFIKKQLVKDLQVKRRLRKSREIIYEVKPVDPRTAIVTRLYDDVLRIFFEVDEYLFDRYSIRRRHPLLDKRIVEFVLTVPPGELVKDGWHRSLFRRSMDGVIPRGIQFRVGKIPFCQSSKFLQLHKSKEYVSEVLGREKSIAWDILDREHLQARFDRFLESQDSISTVEAFTIGRCVTVASFLQWHDT